MCVRSVVSEIQWEMGVSFCPTGEPTGTDLLFSLSYIIRRFGKRAIPHLSIRATDASIHTSRFSHPIALIVTCLAYSSILKIEATFSFETSVDFQRTTRRYIPGEKKTLRNLICEELQFCNWNCGRNEVVSACILFRTGHVMLPCCGSPGFLTVTTKLASQCLCRATQANLTSNARFALFQAFCFHAFLKCCF
jgi:hypothetical protein